MCNIPVTVNTDNSCTAYLAYEQECVSFLPLKTKKIELPKPSPKSHQLAGDDLHGDLTNLDAPVVM